MAFGFEGFGNVDGQFPSRRSADDCMAGGIDYQRHTTGR